MKLIKFLIIVTLLALTTQRLMKKTEEIKKWLTDNIDKNQKDKSMIWDELKNKYLREEITKEEFKKQNDELDEVYKQKLNALFQEANNKEKAIVDKEVEDIKNTNEKNKQQIVADKIISSEGKSKEQKEKNKKIKTFK